eukprot:GSMAST32.ASY1.ANO1.600.1 assembled CDS
MVSITYNDVVLGMTVKVGRRELKITNILKEEGKKGLKVKLTGIDLGEDEDSKQRIRKETFKPADRKLELIDAGDGAVAQTGNSGSETASERLAAQVQDLTIEKTEDGASLTYPIRAGEVKKGGHVLLKDHPCKVIEVTVSKTGKHGHAKAKITGIDIFTGHKYQDVSPTSHNM